MNRDPGVAAKPKASSVRTGRVVMCTSANRQHQEFDVRAPRFSSRGNMNSRIAIVAAVACFASAPSTAQTFSFDPLKDLESAIPAGVPNESRILQARLQVKEMAQDALVSRCTKHLPGRGAASRRLQATRFSALSASSSCSPGARPARASSRQQSHGAPDLHEDDPGAGRAWIRRQPESADLRLRERVGAPQLHPARLGIRRARQPFRGRPRQGRDLMAEPPWCRRASICTS